MLAKVKKALHITVSDYDEELTDLIEAGVAELKAAGILVPDYTAVATATAGLTVTIDAEEFLEVLPFIGQTIFTYTGSAWALSGTTIDLEDYGITVTGTPAEGNKITVTVDADLTKPLITRAIITYCVKSHGQPANYEQLEAAYNGMVNRLQRATGYVDWGLDD